MRPHQPLLSAHQRHRFSPSRPFRWGGKADSPAVITPPPSGTSTTHDQSPKRRPWYRRPSGIAAATVVAASFLLWTYALSGVARKDPPDTLADSDYGAAAQALCAPFRISVDALPPAPASKTPQERAVVLGAATEELRQMVAALRTISPNNGPDQYIVTKWLADWDQYLADRTAYRDILASGKDARFVLRSFDGEFYTKSMDNIAAVNNMRSCDTPGDV